MQIQDSSFKPRSSEYCKSSIGAIALFAILFALAACSSSEQTTADKLKLAVASKMKDPESARFTRLKFGHFTLCGEVNSTNSFGAYAGAERFSATSDFVHLRSEFVERDAALEGSPASSEWKHGTEGFDRFWDACQRDGKPVE